jgi:peptide/nickel transport system permease protein
MRSVLRRLLWLGPTLVFVTLVTFGLLSSVLPVNPEFAALPLFFNPDPGAVERLARNALDRVANAAEPVPEAERTLARLGGAALPFVLPTLDSLSPEGRARVVRALRPVGVRMGLQLDDRWEAGREVLLWTRFWDEHSIDYRPSVAQRAVSRLGQRGTLLRDTEVRQLDTYALDELIAQMPPTGDADLERTRRLADIAADITGQSALRIAPDAGLEAAWRATLGWQDWWVLRRNQFQVYSGTERVAAMLRDTRYGGWVAQAVRRRLGLLEDGRPAWDVLGEGASVTLPLLGLGVLGAWAAAVFGGTLLSVRAARAQRAVRAGALFCAGVPMLLGAVLLSRWLGGAARQLWIGGLLMCAGGAPLGLVEGSRGAESSGADFLRTLQALGVPARRVDLTRVRLASARLTVQLGTQLSSLLTLTCVLEYALGLPGLGTQTINALQHPDLNWLMAITMAAAALAGLWQVFGEWLSELLDPRWATAASGVGGLS